MSGGKGGGGQTAGYRYYFGIHAGIGRGPVDELVEIRVGTKLAAQPHATVSGTGNIDAPQLFGGDKKEGGIVGAFHLMMGEPTQFMPEPLAAMIAPTPATGFRRRVTFFYDGLVASLNPYPKPWSFRIRRAVEGWDGEVFRPDLAMIELGTPLVPPDNNSQAIPGRMMVDVPDNTTSGYVTRDLLVSSGSYPSFEASCRAWIEMPGHGDTHEREYVGSTATSCYWTGPNWSHVTQETPTYPADPLPYFDVVVVPSGGGTLVEIDSVGFMDSEGFVTYPGGYERISFNTLRLNFSTFGQGGRVVIDYHYLPLLPPANLEPDTRICAMNPAHIIFECLTNREWGRGFDRSVLNIPSFEAAAQWLFDEKFGMCLKWSRRDDIKSFIQEVLDTCGASLYMDRQNALLTMKLIRKDYDPSSLPLYDTSTGILAITNSTVNTSTVVINEVIVKYRETVFNEDRSVNVQNLASLQSSGGVFNTMTKTYKGLPTSDLARRVAQRDLRSKAEGLRRFEITMDRRGANLYPGQVFRIQDATRQIPDMVVRVATAKAGTTTDGQVQLLVIQDVFSFPAASFVADQPNTWTPPNFSPCIGEHEVFEAPYFMLRRVMRPADFAYVDNESAYIGVMAERAKPTNAGYNIAVKIGAPSDDEIPVSGEAMYCGYEPDENVPGGNIATINGDTRATLADPYTTTLTGFSTGVVPVGGDGAPLGSTVLLPEGYALHLAVHLWSLFDNGAYQALTAEQVYFAFTGPATTAVMMGGDTWPVVPFTIPGVGAGWLAMMDYAPAGTPGTGAADLVIDPARFLGPKSFTFE